MHTGTSTGVDVTTNDFQIPMASTLYSYFMLQQAIVQNIFPEVQVPTWHASPRAIVCQAGTCTEGKTFCTIPEITVLLPNYINSHVIYHVTRQ